MLRISCAINDEFAMRLDVIKSALLDVPHSGITYGSTREDVLLACASVGAETLVREMEAGGLYDKYLAETELGNLVDRMLEKED